MNNISVSFVLAYVSSLYMRPHIPVTVTAEFVVHLLLSAWRCIT